MALRRIVRPLPLVALGCLLSFACGGETKAPAGLAYSANPATYVKGAAIPANAPTVAGGPVASYAVSPALPAGLALDAATGVISGTPTALAPTASHLVTAANAGGIATARLIVTVNDVAPAGLAYATSPAVYLKGVAIAPNAASSVGGAVTTYEVSPPLPAGLSLDTATGLITGTPAEVWPTSSHLVTAHNSGGSTATILTITVNDEAPVGLAYATATAVYLRGVAIAPNGPSSGGGPVTFYDVSPALPAGLSLSPTTGVLSGTPAAVTPTSNHLVTAYNSGGSATATLTITVNDQAPADLAYATAAPVYLRGVAISPNGPSSGGGPVTSYDVSPALPAGLSLSPTTGVLSGTPTAVTPTSSHLITAYNSGGSTATILTITVSTLAELGGAVVSGELATTTPFARHLLLSGTGFDQLQSARFEVGPRPGAVSRPVSVTYHPSYLARRGLVVSDRQLRLPTFGLHAGTTNLVTVTLAYADGSERTLWTSVAADPYVDPTGIYASPTIKTARQAGDGLGFDYVWIKSPLGPPVVLDTDGAIRWAVPPSNLNAVSSAVYDGALFVGSGLRLTRLEFDGAATTVPLAEPRYSAFHHDMGPGKVGLLAMMDGTSPAGASRIETILVELGPNGEVLREWDMADIFRQEMTAAGDDPVDFVRDGVDWFHMNSAVYLPEDDSLLVSGRESFVVKLDYATGAIKWLFGDPTKHWFVNYPSLRRLAVTLPAGLYPIGQHAVSSPVPGELLLFNNGKNSLNQPAGAPAGEDRTFSAVSRYRIDDALRTAEQIFSYDAGQSILSMFCSSVYEAQPGHYFVTYSMANGTASKLVGLLPSGAKAFDLEFPTTFCSTGWNARPIELERFELR